MTAMRAFPLRAALALPLLLAAGLAACDDPNPNHRAAILDVATGDWRYISDDSDFANVVTWSPDSQSVVVIEGDDAVSRAAATGSQKWRVEGEPDSLLREAAFSPEGDTVALLHLEEPGQVAGTSVELRSADDGTPAGLGWGTSGPVGGGFTPTIHDLAWATDGRLAVIGLRGSFADLYVLDPADDWSVTTEETEGHETRVEAAPTGGAFAVVGAEGLVLYETGTEGRIIPSEITTGGGVLDLEFSPDGRRLALLENEKLSIYDLDTETWTVRLEELANSVAWGPDDTITYSWGGTIFEMDALADDPRVLLELDGGRTVRELEWSPDRTKLSFIIEPPYRD